MKDIDLTRMHSSRMHTARALTVCQKKKLAEYLVRGGCLVWGVSGPRGGLVLPGGVWSGGGGSGPGGVSASVHAGIPPPPREQNHTRL